MYKNEQLFTLSGPISNALNLNINVTNLQRRAPAAHLCGSQPRLHGRLAVRSPQGR